MSDKAPFCNISPESPKGDPHKNKHGFQVVPQNSTLQQFITIMNNNFHKLIKGNYQEFRPARTYTVTRVYDPADKSVYVDVRQITGLTFVNDTTGQTIQWRQ